MYSLVIVYYLVIHDTNTRVLHGNTQIYMQITQELHGITQLLHV